ncbi:phosphotransferase [Streptomyces sp900129855]|uniref:Phosphotransferase n=2 Tax=Streptomyces TaxID=1883 RepID=A0ABV2ZWM3_9ACTN|nr:aminoglycoside phosphotransferase [Streptomyces sp. Root369]
MREPEAAADVPNSAREFLTEQGLATPDETPRWTPMTGGVSSELWRVDLAGGPVAVKGALAKLKVAEDWYAPVNRNAVEWDWLVFAHSVSPGAVPVPLAHDERRGLFAMTFLPPEDNPVWKQLLLDGAVRPADAAAVGDLVGRLHACSCGDDSVARRFRTDENFHQLRIEPYFLATAEQHPDLASALREIAETTAATHRALVHGDVSPKNILIGRSNPVLLDAECAWYGDPAFDVAFVLTHLVLKAVFRPDSARLLEASASALLAAYEAQVVWEPATDLRARAGRLLSALLLARIDGKSPVEYLNPTQRNDVRRLARSLVAGGPLEVTAVLTLAYERVAASNLDR